MKTKQKTLPEIGADRDSLMQALGDLSAKTENPRIRQWLSAAVEHVADNAKRSTMNLSVVAVGNTPLDRVIAWLGADAKQIKTVAKNRDCPMLRWRADFGETPQAPMLHVLAARVDALSEGQSHRMQCFCDHGQVLVIVSAENTGQNADEIAVLNGLLQRFPSAQPVILTSDESSIDWVQSLDSPKSLHWLPMITASGTGDPEWLRKPEDSIRRALAYRSDFSAIDVVLCKTAEKIESEKRSIGDQLHSMTDREEPAVRMQRGRRDDKRADCIRRVAVDGLNELDERISLENERLVQPLGGLSRLARDTANRIRVEDLTREVSSQAIRLRLRSHQVASYNRKLVDALQGQLRADLGKMDTHLREMESEMNSQFRHQYGAESRVALTRLDFRRVWERVENLIDVGEESAIELQRKSFFDLMGAGRQKVFFLIMFIALLGRMGIDEQVLTSFLPDLGPTVIGWLKAGFMVILFSTCLGAMFNTMLLWREEKEEQTRKELDRIRESLIADARKTLEQAQKEKRSVIRSYFKKVQEEAELWLQKSGSERVEQEEAERQQRQHEQRLARQQMQDQLNRLESNERDVTSLIGDAKRLRSDCGILIRSLSSGDEGASVQEIELPESPKLKTVRSRIGAGKRDRSVTRRQKSGITRAESIDESAGITSRFAQRRAQRKRKSS
ncbi:hypothetical protein Enr13x_32460 [Stieleria neptunia]|uniref:Uncharacterized protein n=1 Tax=Stieleria neptunia TaxID=2527979 RepID=A0A518HRB2_9BACT|nr:hypothetical protein [Stieleria neptunia]QDV43390.1 hypothetical protein Enr13x_32460 [Stieleria neptunia]